MFPDQDRSPMRRKILGGTNMGDIHMEDINMNETAGENRSCREKPKRPAGFGKYFGVCASFHHSKACLCPGCALRPSFGIVMYCAKGPCETYGRCETYSEPGLVGSISLGRAENDKNSGNTGNAGNVGNQTCLCRECDVYKQFAMDGEDFCRPETSDPEGNAPDKELYLL